MLKLILGPSGVGKTDALIERIRRDVDQKTRCYLIVPEQQAYISEADLPLRLPENAGLYFKVTSFSRLADDASRIYGGIAKAVTDAGLSALLMWDTLRTNAPLLRRYGKTKHVDSALTALMLSTVSELRSGGITSEALERAASSEEIDASLGDKLSDIALIDATYHAKLEEVFGEDPADKLERFSHLLQEHSFFKDCNVYVDSFTDFTAPEYEIISSILKQADCVTVTLCADSFRSRLPHFEGIMQTRKRLTSLANKTGSDIECIELSEKSDKRPLELQILSKDLWSFSVKESERTAVPQEERGSVRLLCANNLYEEAEAAALHVCELIQSGMRYRDIAVIVRDARAWRGVLDAALDRYGIPYFLSEKTDLSAKPLSRLILCALRSAAHGYRRADVISLLKTGLCGIEMRDAAMFEEYCETWHISGKRFCEDVWSMNPDGLSTTRSERAKEILRAANSVRASLIPPLVHLNAALREATTLRAFCEALYTYLLEVDAPTRLSELAKEELRLHQRREASETVRLYAHLTELLAKLCNLLPDTVMSADEFITAISLLLSNTDLGSVPSVRDCVMIGSASMLRVENVRASLLLGLCEGEFPAAVSDDGVFTDGDKCELEKLNIFFASRTKLRNSEELFYVYRAIAKPTESLWLSTSLRQTDGSMRTPSLAFNRARFLLNKEPEGFDAAEVLAARPAKEDAPTREKSNALARASGIDLYLSQSRISSFVKCPHMHYLKYELSLREPKDSTPSYSDDGTFLHYVFENILRSLVDEEGEFTIPDGNELESLADRIIQEYIDDFFNGSAEWLGDRVLHQLSRLRRLALLMLRDILAEIRDGDFVPKDFERGIGKREANSLPSVDFALKNGATVHLNGKIDRIDVCEKEGKRLIRVVDYKTGEHIFSTKDIETGSDIQLVLYLYAYLRSFPDAEAYGAQYIYGKNVEGVPTILRSGFYLNDAENVTEKTVYNKSLTAQSAEEIKLLQSTMKETVERIAERILSGEAEKTPSEDACRFCAIRYNCDRAYHGKE